MQNDGTIKCTCFPSSVSDEIQCTFLFVYNFLETKFNIDLNLTFSFVSAASLEISQILDGEQTSSGFAGKECDEGLPGFGRQRGILVLHLPLLQAQVQRRQCRRRR